MKNFGDVLEKLSPGKTIILTGLHRYLWKEKDQFVLIYEDGRFVENEKPKTLQQLADEIANGSIERLKSLAVEVRQIQVEAEPTESAD
jgi:hypothetical protein